MSNYDAILIPGGGVLPNGDVPLWVRRRLDEAIAIHAEGFIITLSAGTTHKPPPLEAVWKFLAYAKRSSIMRVMAL